MLKIRTLLFIGLFLISSCDKPNFDSNNSKKAQSAYSYKGTAAAQDKIDKVSKKADLRSKLPSNAIAYMRIPNFWSFFSTPKGNVLDKALRDSKHVETINKLKRGLFKNVFSKDQSGARHHLALFFYHLNAPIEMAVLNNFGQSGSATLSSSSTQSAPNYLLYSKLDFKTIDEFSQFLKVFISEAKNVKELMAVDANGEGSLMLDGLKYFYKFNPLEGELILITGLTATQSRAKTIISSLKKSRHVMHDLESKIDDSYLGFFFWIDTSKVTSNFGRVFNSKIMRKFSMPLAMTKEVAGGWGVSHDKGRIQLVVKTHFNMTTYVDNFTTPININAAGEPTLVIALAIPGPTQWQSMKGFVKGSSGSYRQKRFDSGMDKMKQMFGFNVVELIHAIGPQLVLYFDKTGEYFAIQIRDKKKFSELLKNIVKTSKLPFNQYKSGEQEINYLQIPLLPRHKMHFRSKLPTLFQAFLKRRIHLYWVEQGNYAILASVPQMLSDQSRYPQKINIGKWLVNKQKQSTNKSIMLLSTKVNSSPRHMYYMYLQMLQMIGDMVDYPVELANLPSAWELDLPKEGSFGLKIDLDKEFIAFELLFESNPFEFIAGTNMTTVAVVGILAAIAIPAYNDYAIRAKVAMGISYGELYKTEVNKYYLKYKKFPDQQALASAPFKDLVVLSKLSSQGIRYANVEPQSGKVVIRFTGKKLWGASIILSPIVEKGSLVRWQCESTLAYKLTPAICRH